MERKCYYGKLTYLFLWFWNFEIYLSECLKKQLGPFVRFVRLKLETDSDTGYKEWIIDEKKIDGEKMKDKK